MADLCSFSPGNTIFLFKLMCDTKHSLNKEILQHDFEALHVDCIFSTSLFSLRLNTTAETVSITVADLAC